MGLKSFIGDGENFVVDALINFQPVERFENRRDMAEYRGSRNSTSSSPPASVSMWAASASSARLLV